MKYGLVLPLSGIERNIEQLVEYAHIVHLHVVRQASRLHHALARQHVSDCGRDHLHLRDGQLVEHWAVRDDLDMLQQIGIVAVTGQVS